jgi:ribosomal 50S subunit-associated protein YjgA (DUF615 family)
MSKITVELNDEEIDNIIVDQLFQTRSVLLEDYDRVNARVFSVDPKEDRKQIRKMIRSLERVIEWYTVPGSVVFDKLEK